MQKRKACEGIQTANHKATKPKRQQPTEKNHADPRRNTMATSESSQKRTPQPYSW
jgi:hypothetical protein